MNISYNEAVNVDLFIGDCPLATSKLLYVLGEALNIFQARNLSVPLKFALTSIPNPLLNNDPTEDPFFESSVLSFCLQKDLQTTNIIANSTEFLFFSCLSLISEDFSRCLDILDSNLLFNLSSCSTGDAVSQAVQNLVYAFPVTLYPNLPILYINGHRYCGDYTSQNISTAFLTTSLTPISLRNPSDVLPAPLVNFPFYQTCANPASNIETCIAGSSGNDAAEQFVPIVGLLFLTFSMVSLVCVIIFKRRLRRGRFMRYRENLRRSPTALNDLNLLEFIMFLAQDEQQMRSNNLELHKENVKRRLELLPVTNNPEEPQSCAICLENVTGNFYQLPCDHIFHQDCLKNWLESGKSDCPICRTNILQPTSPFSSSYNDVTVVPYLNQIQNV